MSYRRSPVNPDTQNVPVASTPSNPASGKYKFYFKSDGDLYTLNNSGIESHILTNRAFLKEIITITSTPYIVLSTDEVILADATTSLLNIHLEPAATAGEGRVITVKRLDNVLANVITIFTGTTGETIDGVATKTLNAQYDSITIICNGSDWFII
jgi:hypothetical protein